MNNELMKSVIELGHECADQCRQACNGEISDEPQSGDWDALFDLLGVSDWNEFRQLDDHEEISFYFQESYCWPFSA